VDDHPDPVGNRPLGQEIGDGRVPTFDPNFEVALA
jgi:hypothetical protein